jgi:type VI secretion system ImpM family protein
VTAWRGGAAILGKVPWDDEFLREAGLSRELQRFGEWLHRSAASIVAHPRRTDEGLATPPAAHGFVLHLGRPGDPPAGVAGVVSASEDRAGRSYPLAVAAPVAFGADIAAHPEIVPIVLETYWQRALDVLTAVRGGPIARDDHGLRRLTEEPIESAEAAVGLYAAWARRTPLADLCALLDRPIPWFYRAAQAIVRTVHAGDRSPGHRDARSVRVPLGLAAGSALCVWLDVLGRAARAGRGGIATFFWSHDEHAGEALLSLDPPDHRSLAALWHAGTDRDGSLDLTPAGDPRADLALYHGAGDSVWTVLERLVVLPDSLG